MINVSKILIIGEKSTDKPSVYEVGEHQVQSIKISIEDQIIQITFDGERNGFKNQLIPLNNLKIISYNEIIPDKPFLGVG